MRDLLLSATIVLALCLALVRPFVGTLVWSWISFMNPHQLAYGFASTVPWAALAFAAILGGCLIAREPRRPAINAVTILMVVFLAIITVTSFTALADPAAVWSKWDRVFKVIIVLLLTASLLTDRWRVHALVWLMVLSMGFFGIRGGIFTVVTGGGFIVLGPEDTMIADRNHLAVALLVSLPLMNYLRLQSPSRLVRWGLLIAMCLTLFAVIGSQSRGALLGLGATAAIFWLRSRNKVLSGAVLAVALVGAIAFMPASWIDRMQSVQSYEQDTSAMGRIRIWGAALSLAMERPLVGGGFRAVYNQAIVDRVAPGTTARADHSIWFEVLGEQGFVGFFVWLAIIGAGVAYSARIVRLARNRPDLTWASDLARNAQVAIVAYAAGGTFLSLGYWDMFWTLIIIVGAVHALVVQAATQDSTVALRASRPGWRARTTAHS